MDTEPINRAEAYGDIFSEFVAETLEQLQTIEDLILSMEQNEGGQESVTSIFRIMHNVKGAAGCFDFVNLTQVAHFAESILVQLRDGERSATQEITSVVFEVVDLITLMLSNDDDNAQGHESLTEKLKIIYHKGAEGSSAEEHQSTEKLQSPKEEPPVFPPDEPRTKPAKRATTHTSKNKDSSQQSLRLPVQVLDELLELIGEVVLGRNQWLHSQDENPIFNGLSNSITKLHRHVIQTRMQPVSTVFQRYNRMIRDLCVQTGKKINLTVEGEEIEFDRTLLENLADPLTHLLRNSADHGLETPEERIAAGKSAEGNIWLRAYLESGQIVIEVQDDGKGMDHDRILAKAFEMGLVTTEQISTLTNEEIYPLVFLPGFSTKEKTSELSGRGVGMDVVKSNLEKMGFSLEISSKTGKGTRFSARMAQTQAIVNSSVISSLIVGLDHFKFAIPETAVSEMFTLNPSQLERQLSVINGQQILRLRGSSMPLVPWSDLLGAPEAIKPGRRGRCLFVVLQFKKNVFAIQVDRILETEEIVVKRLPQLLKSRGFFEGTTILSDGEIAMILDINGLVEKSGLHFEQRSIRNLQALSEQNRTDETNEVLLLELANQEIAAIPLDLVAGVHKVKRSQIQSVGRQEYALINSRNLQLVRLDHFLDFTPLGDNKAFFIVETQQENPVGILGSKLLGHINFNQTSGLSEAREDGILGHFYSDQRLITLLDLHGLKQAREVSESIQIADELLQDCRILLVEDTAFYRHFVLNFLRSLGLTAVTAVHSGIAALGALQGAAEEFHLIISDIEMPEMGGIELAETLKADPKYAHIPLLALTGLNQESDRTRCLQAGFDAFEVKVNKKHIMAAIESLLSQSMGVSQ